MNDGIIGIEARKRLLKFLLVPDSHHPYHDKKAWALAMKAGAVLKPDGVIVFGDFGDCHSISRHAKDSDKPRHFKVEVAGINRGLDDLDALGAKYKWFIKGNHEERLDKYIRENAEALEGMVTIEGCLNLEKRGWNVVPYMEYLKLGKMHFTHDAGYAGKYAVYETQAVFEGNVAFGHTHRLGWIVVGNAKGKPHVGVNLGWLGDFDAVHYEKRIKTRRAWSHGFGIGYFEPNGNWHITPIAIVNNAVVIEGKVIR